LTFDWIGIFQDGFLTGLLILEARYILGQVALSWLWAGQAFLVGWILSQDGFEPG